MPDYGDIKWQAITDGTRIYKKPSADTNHWLLYSDSVTRDPCLWSMPVTTQGVWDGSGSLTGTQRRPQDDTLPGAFLRTTGSGNPPSMQNSRCIMSGRGSGTNGLELAQEQAALVLAGWNTFRSRTSRLTTRRLKRMGVGWTLWAYEWLLSIEEGQVMYGFDTGAALHQAACSYLRTVSGHSGSSPWGSYKFHLSRTDMCLRHRPEYHGGLAAPLSALCVISSWSTNSSSSTLRWQANSKPTDYQTPSLRTQQNQVKTALGGSSCGWSQRVVAQCSPTDKGTVLAPGREIPVRLQARASCP